MIYEAFITCAVTGAGATAGKSPHVPVTPRQIADASIEAAKAGAAVAHIHVRDPKSGAGARSTELYKEVVDRIRSSSTDVVINLTAGMGGDMVLGGVEKPLPLRTAGTDMAGAKERLAHVSALLPEICTLDCGTMNFLAGGDYIMVNSVDICVPWPSASRRLACAQSARCSIPVTCGRSETSSPKAYSMTPC